MTTPDQGDVSALLDAFRAGEGVVPAETWSGSSVIGTGVGEDGRREVLGVAVGGSDAELFWPMLLR